MRADAFSHLPASLERAPLLLAHTDRSPDYVTGADGVQQQQPAADSPLAKLASTPKLHEKGSPAMRLKALGISLEGRASTPIGNYVPAVLTGDILTISGQLPKAADGTVATGQVGDGDGFVSVEDGQKAAREAAITLLATVESLVGDLSKVKRIVRIGGFVSAPAGFTQQPGVINGCSDFLREVFGDAGRSARSAVGVSSLPMNAVCELEATVQIIL